MRYLITRGIEVTKALATDPGRLLSDFINYFPPFVDNTVRCLRNGLTFGDNFDCQRKVVALARALPQTLTASKTVTGISVQRVVSSRYALSSFGWYYDNNGQLTVIAGFNGATPITPGVSYTSSGAGPYTVVVTSNGHGFLAGDQMTITSATNTNANGTYLLQAVTTNTFSYFTQANPASGTLSYQADVPSSGSTIDTELVLFF